MGGSEWGLAWGIWIWIQIQTMKIIVTVVVIGRERYILQIVM
jgi:hypothetical protein